ncbi:MAG: hypothetical protein GY820_01895 [Gammaproteobacteria bacterium]|nr:hypothetical protein [Gammaproteobacteria bacterium]
MKKSLQVCEKVIKKLDEIQLCIAAVKIVLNREKSETVDMYLNVGS